MKKISLFAMFAFLLLLSGCTSVTSGINVSAEADETVKFSGYKSYAWIGDVAVLDDPENKWQPPKMNVAEDIKFLIDRELRKRGLVNHAENPDLAVIFFMGVDMEAMKLKTDPKTKKDILKKVPGASLMVALIDAKTEYAIWVGEASSDLTENPSEETLRKRLDYAVTEMFKKLPKD
ncbi:DUF4136 domain-containing protein [Methylicorpusculum sp.]|uniref:DUF4136 domain-containing protein n=1 Tax=Methylicorpusculum sp. TaxID=2713644 RepID=UPI0027262558|nr:DUF4136 domain-containing protein [Methylicorpusculum sp.]MDO8845107.1 DUF4136 domain-containing protein [Methylicorpusculum sp.]MDP2100617.1 DUF4136 domain-containing protein [Methylobacter sp.]MDP3531225.1 DUF4136 domain-containing protein [Methylicorpusculum sp.]MDZ4151319.1 DUF4136 domain-containing protein [Methylicorpusculum sp.]